MMNIIHERAKAHQMVRQYEDAINDFTTVIKHNPRNAHAQFRRGFAWKSMGQFEKAADDMETAKVCMSVCNSQLQ
jgi:tetratricopeptide (TPR) repeat protein